MNGNLKVAAAIAAILSAGATHAQTAIDPTSAQGGIPLYIAGSSAAKGAIIAVLETSSVFCGSSTTGYSVFSSTPDPNFFAVSCKPTGGASGPTGLSQADGNHVYTVWYRAEGGSVTGALPIISGSSINQLTLNTNYTSTASGFTVTVGGNATGNGLNDSFTNVFQAPVQLGITDVEPGALVKNNYPSSYSTAAFGKATSAQLGNLGLNNGQVIFDQVFGVFVNVKTGSGFSTAEQAGAGQTANGTASGLSISKQALASILQGRVADWGHVPFAGSTTGAAVAPTGTAITIVNREQGSGSRTATDIFFTQDHCSTNTANQPIDYPGAGSTVSGVLWPTEYFSTLDVLTNANTIAGSITYATIEQAGTNFPNLTLVAIDGVQPSNLAAATGQYGDWFEAYAITPGSVTGDQATLDGNLVAAFEDISVSLAGGQIDLLANPLLSSKAATIPVTGSIGTSTAKPIYTNLYQRNANSCQDPINVLK